MRKYFDSSAPLLPYRKSKVGNLTFADCAESTVRNLFRIVIGKKGRYDVSIIDRLIDNLPWQVIIQPTFNQRAYVRADGLIANDLSDPVSNRLAEIKDFFIRYNTDSDQNSSVARNEWAAILSNIPGGIYAREFEGVRCEIDTGERGIISVLRGLLGLPNSAGWVEIFDLFSRASKQEFSINSININALGLGRLDFSTSQQGDFELVFADEHFYLGPLNSVHVLNEDQVSSKEMTGLLTESKQIAVTDLNSASIIMDLLSLYPQSDSKTELLLREHAQGNNYSIYLIRAHTEKQINDLLSGFERQGISLNDEMVRGLYSRFSNAESEVNFLFRLFSNQLNLVARDLYSFSEETGECSLSITFRNSVYLGTKERLTQLLQRMNAPVACVDAFARQIAEENVTSSSLAVVVNNQGIGG
ncbi:MAG: hypothetical protein HQK53_13360 [Oligoflexia bacterium]|nr:hypothetical protein [Oligoflexia bacterium]